MRWHPHVLSLQAQLEGLGEDDTDMKRQRDTPDISPGIVVAEVGLTPTHPFLTTKNSGTGPGEKLWHRPWFTGL